MNKIIIALLLTASTVQANPSTGDVKRPFMANGGFKGLCDSLGWDWGYWKTGGVGGFGTYACLNKRYQMINRISKDEFVQTK